MILWQYHAIYVQLDVSSCLSGSYCYRLRLYSLAPRTHYQKNMTWNETRLRLQCINPGWFGTPISIHTHTHTICTHTEGWNGGRRSRSITTSVPLVTNSWGLPWKSSTLASAWQPSPRANQWTTGHCLHVSKEPSSHFEWKKFPVDEFLPHTIQELFFSFYNLETMEHQVIVLVSESSLNLSDVSKATKLFEIWGIGCLSGCWVNQSCKFCVCMRWRCL
jgi:hypothetical protein